MTNPSTDKPGLFATGGILKLGGRELILSRTRFIDLEDYNAWLKSEIEARSPILRFAKANLKGLEPDERAAVLRQAMSEAARELDPDSPLGQAVQRSPESAARMIFLHARRKHPAIVYEEILEQVRQEDLDSIIEQLNGMTGEAAKNPPAPDASGRPGVWSPGKNAGTNA